MLVPAPIAYWEKAVFTIPIKTVILPQPMPSTASNLTNAGSSYRTPTANIFDLLTIPRRSPRQSSASSSTRKGENGCHTFSPYLLANSGSVLEAFPTMQEVERGDRQQIARWHYFLSIENESQQQIMDRIADRFMNMGGLTPGLGKKVGLTFLQPAVSQRVAQRREKPIHAAGLACISILASLLVSILARIPRP